MPIQFTNTLTGRKEPFTPLHSPQVTLYVCGVTVYDESHLGHVRGAIVFDVLRRFLEQQGFEVIHVRNITDVDDKIIQRAQQETDLPGDLKERTETIAHTYTESFHKDFSSLGLLVPEHEPKATEYIPKIQIFIQSLIDNGFAYEGEDGVYFSVRKLGDRYGVLSNQKLDQNVEEQPEEAGKGKKDPLDFALWKRAKPDEPSWESPWGGGRPGWHIECSAMSTALLGDQFDIHGGGRDLVFPHHENELAQAVGAAKPFARFWMHNGLLTVDGQKMAKSLGNVVKISEVLDRHPADIIRLFFLSAHYSSPMDFTWEHLDEAANGYARLLVFLLHVEQLLDSGKEEREKLTESAQAKFISALEDDLNTPQALAALHDLVTQASDWFKTALKGDEPSREKLRGAAVALRELAVILGLNFFQSSNLPEQILQLRTDRDEARDQKDFEKGDVIREQVRKAGFLMEDTAAGTVLIPDV